MTATLLRKNANKISASTFRRLVNCYFPFLGAGIKVTKISDDYRFVQVEMKLRWYNKNYVGTQFGGSIYAMTDPFYMLMLINNLGRNYIVWDKAAKIDFIKPGKGKLTAKFELSEEQIQDIIAKLEKEAKLVFDLTVEIMDEKNDIVASVCKTLYVRNKT